MTKTPASALFSAIAACLLALGAAHFAAKMLSGDVRIALAADITLGGVMFAFILLASRTVFRTKASLDYWLLGAGAIFCGACIAGFNLTHDFAFILAGSAVTFSATLASLFRDLDERVKAGPLFGGYLAACLLAYLLAAS